VTPRIELVGAADAPLLARPYYEGGDPGPIVGALAHVPEVLDVTLPFVGTVLGPTSIGVRTKELVILRTSALLACHFCVNTHSDVARRTGLEAAEVRALRDEVPYDTVFGDPAERALLAWVDEVATGRGPVPDPVADALAAHHPTHEIVELTVLVGATMLLNRLCSALALPVAPEALARLDEEDLRWG
jgi:AhpD family alkylhydroperoxidase